MLSATSTAIPKFADRLPGEDYRFLREQGLKYLQQFGHALWTDYNVHDPGVTLLETLCYALTDLAYKAQLPIEDLLANRQPDGRPFADGLYPARDILSCNPLTARDYSMLLMDCPGVEFGCLQMLDAPGPAFHVDCESSELTYAEKYALRERHRAPLEDHGMPSALVDRLSGLFSLTFADAAGYEAALRDLLDEFEWQSYGDLLLRMGDRYPTLPPQGLSDVLLQLEPDPRLGQLNLLSYPLDFEADGRLIDLRAYLETPDEALLDAALPTAPDYDVLFEPVVWNDSDGVYSTALRLDLAGGVYRLGVNLVSQTLRAMDAASPLSNAYRPHVDAALAAAAAAIYADFKARIQRIAQVVAGVRQRIHAHRNLCEDFAAIRIARTDEIGLCAQIEVAESADVSLIDAEVRYRVQNFLAPRAVFKTLRERLESGQGMDAIFNGPALRHGFLDPAEVARSGFRDEVHTSDLIHLIMDVPGVLAVRDLQLSRFHHGLTLNPGERWCLPLSGERGLQLSDGFSRLTFYKGVIPVRSDATARAERLAELRSLQRHKRLEPGDYDLAVAPGRDRQVQRFHSVQNELPLNYGIGRAGLSAQASAARHAQARQLKSFLLLFDQLLADYLAQLANLGRLFSLDPALKRSYFAQPLYSLPESFHVSEAALRDLDARGVPDPVRDRLRELQDEPHADRAGFDGLVREAIGTASFDVHGESIADACRQAAWEQPLLPGLAPLLKDLVDEHAGSGIDWSKPDSYAVAWQAYRTRHAGDWIDTGEGDDGLRETPEQFARRRNAILDHLMARFAETFASYAVQVYSLDRRNAPEQLIEDKLAFLADYPAISAGRGRAFDYRSGSVWNSDNVSGLERRAARRLGMESFQRRWLSSCHLSAFEVFPENDSDGIDEFWFRLRDAGGDIVLTSTRHFLSLAEAREEIERVVEHGVDLQNWALRQNSAGRYYVVLLDRPEDGPDADVLGQRRGLYLRNQDDARRELLRGHAAVQRAARLCEGFHLVEHLLLRPRVAPDYELMPVCTSADCDTCVGFLDPYSFRATVVAPANAGRFVDQDFRRFAELTLREAAPAHVHLKVCWVDESDLQAFESAYGGWLTEMARYPADAAELTQAQNRLLDVLSGLRSVYPPVRLHECGEERGAEDAGPAVLNHSILGSQEDG